MKITKENTVTLINKFINTTSKNHITVTIEDDNRQQTIIVIHNHLASIYAQDICITAVKAFDLIEKHCRGLITNIIIDNDKKLYNYTNRFGWFSLNA